MSVKKRILLRVEKRMLPILLALTILASGVLVHVSAAPPTGDAYTYKISEFTAENVGANAQSISNVPNLFSWTSQAKNKKYFYLETDAHGYTGQVLRDGQPDKSSGARETIIEPLPYMDADESLFYPVTEVSGKRTLTYMSSMGSGSATNNMRAATTFFSHKKSELQPDGSVIDTYFGTNFALGYNNSAGLLLYRTSNASGALTLTLTRNSEGEVISASYGGGISEYPLSTVSSTKLQSFLVDENGNKITDTEVLASAAADFGAKTDGLTEAEQWIDYRMFYIDNKSYVDLTLNLNIDSEIKTYTFRFPLLTPSDSAFKINLAFGCRYSDQTHARRYPDYYADFTVQYDASEYHMGNTKAIVDAIDTLVPYSLKENPDLLADLEGLYAQYQGLTPEQQVKVTNSETLLNAITAIRSGKYFYDTVNTADYWAEKGTRSGYSYYETNGMLPDNGQMVSISGKMFINSDFTSNLTGPIFKFDKEDLFFWIGINGKNPAELYTGGRNGQYLDITQPNKAPVAENYIEGDASVTFKQETWVDFIFEFDFELGCYVYKVSGVDNDGNSAKVVYKNPGATTLFDNARLVVRTGLLSEIFKDISVGLLDSNYAEALINSLPDPENVTVDHEDDITVVQQIIESRIPSEEFEKISAATKTRMDNILIALAAAIEARDNNLSSDVTITFEDGEPGKVYFEAIRANAVSGWGVENNPFPGVGNTSDRVLRLSPNYAPVGDDTSNYAIYKLKNGVVPGTKLLNNFSGKVYMEKGGTPIVVYDYKSPDEWQGFRIYLNNNNNVVFRPYHKRGAGKNVNNPQTYETSFALENTGGPNTFENVWADFNIEYSLLKCKISIRFYNEESNTYLGGYDREFALTDTCETLVGFAVAGDSSSVGYFDDIFVNFQSGQAYSDAKNFMDDHNYILSLVPAHTYLSYNDFDYVDAVKTAYSSLSADAKKYIPFVDSRIVNIESAREAYQNAPNFEERKARDEARLAAKNAVSGNYDNYTVTEDFVNGDLSLFQPAKQAINTGVVEVVDNEVFGSKALRMDGRSVITLKELLLPDRPQVAKVQYKIYMEGSTPSGSNKKGLIIYPDYHNINTFNGINFIQSESNLKCSYVRYTPPDATSYNTSTDLVLGTVWNVSLSFTDRGSCAMQISDANGAILSITQSAKLYSLFTLASNDMTVYIDDVSVTYRKGNYDVDVESTGINVYYTANTWVKPGDVALISGENLKNNVARLEILPLPNNPDASKGYINRTWFDYDGVHNDEFSKAPTTPYWNGDAAQAVDIVQWTDNSLKFVVPTKNSEGDPFPNGIYAVKLYSSRDSSYEIIYINAPSVDYTVGTDGGITAPGGTMRVVGKNLAHNLDSSKLKVFIIGGGIERQINVSAVQSNYSISVDIPVDVAYGDYELWIYGGYGDGTAWTIPHKFTVARAVRDGWNKTVFNIRDYGATGNTDQNATPFFINALAAISENGGGILYLPSGQYDITAGLIVPENCVITGEGLDKTAINFRPYTYAINRLPTALFSFTKNVEISNLAIRGSRVGGVFRGYSNNSDNLYFENLYIAIQPYAGTVTEGTGGTYRGLVSSTELYGMVSMESVNPVLAIQSKGNNVQIRNFDASRALGRNRPMVNDNNGSYFWQVDNIKTTGEWSEVVISKSLWENSEHGPNSCLGVWGHGLYFANNKLFDRTDNNRELYVADRNAPYRDQITPVSDDPNNVKYYLVKGLNSARFTDKDVQMYIVNGQGIGQTREIIGYEQKVVNGVTMYIATINRPFTVAPNRNSTVVIRRPRENIFFVNNDYSNGGAGGFYGGVADAVYDGNTWTNCTSIYQMGIFYDVNWYLSIVGDVVNEGPNGKRGHDWRAQSGKIAQMAFLMRDCQINGMYNNIKPGGTNSLVDVIIDHNTWSGSDYAISFDGYTQGGRYQDMDGVLFARNVLEYTPHMFNPANTAVPESAMATTNSAASKRMIMLDIQVDNGDVLMGDINRDGKVSLKDATLILFAVVGKVELSDLQNIVADVNGDGFVSTKDATMIHMYLIGSVTKFASPIINP